MVEVKLSQEQADAIRRIKKDTDGGITNDNIRNHLRKGWGIPPYRALNDLSTKEFLDALYIGYEVEPEFKVGDWVVCEDDNIGEIEFINEFDGWANIGWSKVTTETGICLADTYNLTEIKRHATPEEIAKEKQRRWWAKHGRDVWELKQGDILMGIHRALYEVTADPKSHRFGCYTGNDSRDFDIEECKRDNWRVVCFAEERKDA